MSVSHGVENNRVTIIGGGIAGCLAALKLAGAGFSVNLIEQKNGLLEGTSGSTPGRMGLGFHYRDIPTALRYLRATIEFAKRYPGFKIGEELPSEHYLRHGLYLVMEDTQVPWKKTDKKEGEHDLKDVAEALKNEYTRLVEESPGNKLFGEPEDFYQVVEIDKTCGKVEFKSKKGEILQELDLKEVNTDKVSHVIRTQEHLLDWDKFKGFILEEITKAEKPSNPSHGKINVITEAKMTGAQYGKAGTYAITFDKSQGTEKKEALESDFVVNSSWQNSETIDSMIGFEMQPCSRTNRMKFLVEVELPEELHNSNSMFFYMGEGAMFSNMGKNKEGKYIGRLTFSKVTNYKNSMDLDIPAEFKRFLEEGMSDEEKTKFGNDIIEGVSQYVPVMRKAKLRDVYPGIVKSRGTVELANPKSDVHNRNYDGIELRSPDWVSHDCMKLFYGESNAMKILAYLKQRRAERNEPDFKVEERSGYVPYNLEKIYAQLQYVLQGLGVSDDSVPEERYWEEILDSIINNEGIGNFSTERRGSAFALAVRRDSILGPAVRRDSVKGRTG